MIFISIEDFYQKASSCQRLTREEEIQCARQMNAGDSA
ncbi:sigma-70 factor domain-containing protein, partial [Klebsiella pneumoniae]